MAGKNKQSFVKSLQDKYRLVILNDETFEEKSSIILSKVNIYVVIGTITIFLVLITSLLIMFTPIKHLIPGYGDVKVRQQLISMTLKSDSLEQMINRQSVWLNDVREVLEGDSEFNDSSFIAIEVDESTIPKARDYENVNIEEVTSEDIELRKEVQNQAYWSSSFSSSSVTHSQSIEDLDFFSPIEGYLSSKFNPVNDHYGIDVIAPENEPVKCTLSGRVISADWNLKMGHVIAIQHEKNLVSFYKHNAVLLKKVGSFVEAGDVIAIIGSSGELSTGPHLHFELWHNGLAVNPIDYINF